MLADPGAVVVRPQALTLHAATSMIREALERDVDVEFADACHEATIGNPLLLRSCSTRSRPRDRAEAKNAARVHEIGLEAVSRSVHLRPASAGRGDAARARVAVLGDDVRLADAADLAALDRDLGAHCGDVLTRNGILRLERARCRSSTRSCAPRSPELNPSERERAHCRRAARRRGRVDGEGRRPPAADRTGNAADRRRGPARGRRAPRSRRATRARPATTCAVRSRSRSTRSSAASCSSSSGSPSASSTARSPPSTCARRTTSPTTPSPGRGRARARADAVLLDVGRGSGRRPRGRDRFRRRPGPDPRRRLEAGLLSVTLLFPPLYPLAVQQLERVRTLPLGDDLGSRTLLALLSLEDMRSLNAPLEVCVANAERRSPAAPSSRRTTPPSRSRRSP